MKRRYLVTAEIVAMLVVCGWVGFALLRDADRPEDSVAIKLELPGAGHKVYLYRQSDGQYRYQVNLNDGTKLQLDAQAFTEKVYEEQHSRGWLSAILNINSTVGYVWVAVGFLGQVFFTGRMFVQWLVTEKRKEVTVPPVFWWMSLLGSSMLLAYFVWRWDPVGVLGQAFGWFIYVRNLWYIYVHQAEGGKGEVRGAKCEVEGAEETG